MDLPYGTNGARTELINATFGREWDDRDSEVFEAIVAIEVIPRETDRNGFVLHFDVNGARGHSLINVLVSRAASAGESRWAFS